MRGPSKETETDRLCSEIMEALEIKRLGESRVSMASVILFEKHVCFRLGSDLKHVGFFCFSLYLYVMFSLFVVSQHLHCGIKK